MRTWLLIHGAWHGGWCWETVRNLMEARGDRVVTPTLSGLGDRAEQISRDITLQTWIDEIVSVMAEQGLTDTTLVGHSFAGSFLAGIAEAVPGRVDRLVYLDAMVIEDGECVFDTVDPAIVAERRKLAEETSGGLSLPPPPASGLGITDPDQAAVVEARMTPHPLSTYLSPLHLTRPPGEGFPCTYVACTEPLFRPTATARTRAKAYGWDYREIATGHDLMITDPEGTVDLLAEIIKH